MDRVRSFFKGVLDLNSVADCEAKLTRKEKRELEEA